MGLFQFIKDAGSKLFGGSAQAATPDALKQAVQSHGFDAGKLNIIGTFDALRALTADNPEQQPRLNGIEQLATERMDIAARTIEMRRAGDADGDGLGHAGDCSESGARGEASRIVSRRGRILPC